MKGKQQMKSKQPASAVSMSAAPRSSRLVEPMTMYNVTQAIELMNREVDPRQYLRETSMNGIEARGTKIVFGIEWEAVRLLDRYRLVVADNGRGMTSEELQGYMNTLCRSAKPDGGEHGNFGIGGRITLLPWNEFGVVIVSHSRNKQTKEIERSMMRIRYDPDSKLYGAQRYLVAGEDGRVTGGEEIVVDPEAVVDEGICYGNVLSTALGKEFTGTGTAIICLGNTGTEDTILPPAAHRAADEDDEPERRSNIWALNWLNRRYYRMPKGVTIYVEAIENRDRADWPKTPVRSHENCLESKRVMGAEHFITRSGRVSKGNPATCGEMTLKDGSRLLWSLREKVIKGSQGAFGRGVIAALYKDELYDHGATKSVRRWRYNRFSILSPDLIQRLTIIVEPPLAVPGKAGVRPKLSRATLVYQEADGKIYGEGKTLPWDEWGAEFSMRMPAPIRTEANKIHIGMAKSGDWGVQEFRAYWARWAGNDIAKLVRQCLEAVVERVIHTRPKTGRGVPRSSTRLPDLKEPLPAVDPQVTLGTHKKNVLVDHDEIHWCKFSEIPGLAPYEKYAAYLEPNGALYFNEGSPILVAYYNHAAEFVEVNATSLCAVTSEEREKITRGLMHNAFARGLYAKLCHLQALTKVPGWTTSEVRRLALTPEVLTFAILGLVEQDTYIAEAAAKMRAGNLRKKQQHAPARTEQPQKEAPDEEGEGS